MEYMYTTRSTEITGDNGNIIASTGEYMAPEAWSQTACDILSTKYFRKAGLPEYVVTVEEDDVPVSLWRCVPCSDPLHPRAIKVKRSEGGGECHAEQVFSRIAGCWAYWGWKYGYFGDDEEFAIAQRDEWFRILYSQDAAPNSPQFFNTGLHWAYGLAGDPQGHWRYDEEAGGYKQTTSAYEYPSVNACFILSVEDDLVNPGGIMDLWQREARIYKHGGGVGSNFSAIRGDGEPLSGGGVSSGLMSWLLIGDRAGGAIKSGGVTRRAAKMVIVDIDHPDVVPFIEWKMREELKVAYLNAGSKIVTDYVTAKQQGEAPAALPVIPQGLIDNITDGFSLPVEAFDTDWQGEAYRTVAGQNSNNSIMLTDRFMDAVKHDECWELKRRTDGAVTQKIKARELWDKIVHSAWVSGDPGLMFFDTINEFNTAISDGNIVASNPCCEYLFLNNTACNLASLNLIKFLDEEKSGKFDVDRFQDVVRSMTMALDISVSIAQLPSLEVAKGTHEYRTIGLGYANLGALLMRMGVPYGSERACNITSGITSLLTATSYAESIRIAGKLGGYPRYEDTKIDMKSVLYKHWQRTIEKEGEVDIIGTSSEERDILRHAVKEWDDINKAVEERGDPVRNAQVTCIAPTGTIGLLMDCDTTGVEPDYALVKHKKLAGGGWLKIVNKSVEHALRSLGYSDSEIVQIEAHIESNNSVENCHIVRDEDKPVFRCAMGDVPVLPESHVMMVAAATPFISGSISKTVNMPHDCTPADFDRIYRMAYEVGCKNISLYRDGSKLSQPLNASRSAEDAPVIEETQSISKRVALPSRRDGYTQKMSIDGQTIYLRTGEYPDGRLGEIFIDMHREGASTRSLMNCFAIAVSLGLQHGVPVEEYVNAYVGTRFEPAGLVRHHDSIKMASSIIDLIFRDLGISYLNKELGNVKPVDVGETVKQNERQSKALCPKCGNYSMIQTGICKSCEVCGETTGCG